MAIQPPAAQQTTREQCRIGDFVPAEFVPEWRDETEPQAFWPRTYDLSPIISGVGGRVPAGENERWVFRREDARWVRDS